MKKKNIIVSIMSVAESAWVFDFDRTEQYDNNYQYDGGLNSYPSS